MFNYLLDQKEKLANIIEKVPIDYICLVFSIVLYFLLLVSIMQISLFSPASVVLMHLFPLSIVYLLYRRIDQLHVIGLINYLPGPLQHFFLEASVFDVLCHIWFVPRISLYVKRFFLPFFVKMTREEALKMFYDLDPELALTLNTQGVANILPAKLTKSLMPKNKPLMVIAKPKEDINVISYNEHGARITKPTTQLISSGSRTHPYKSKRLDQKITDFAHKIPTLESAIGKILGDQFRQLMSVFSQKTLAVISILTGTGILAQVFFSKYARETIKKWANFSVLSGSFLILLGSLLGIVIKIMHNNIDVPQKENFEQWPKPVKVMKHIKTRFNSKADKQGFFNPDLKMAL